MSFLMKNSIHIIASILLLVYNVLSLKVILGIYVSMILFYVFLNIRNDFIFLPLFILVKVQGKNFKVSRDLKEIKQNLKGSDKGEIIEDLFALPAWAPILSVESTNGKVWEAVKDNLMKFKKHIPCKEKIGFIAKKEAQELLRKKELIDSKIIAKLTLKIFLKWLFCENNKPLLSEDTEEENNKVPIDSSEKPKILTYENAFEEKDFEFINQFITDEFLEDMFYNGLQWRKEIALKGEGCKIRKMRAVNNIVDILKKSKFKDVFDWDNPECFSFIMQPFIISPMINICDIAVSLKNEMVHMEKYEEFLGYLDHCLFVEHPFPVLERYIKETNTQVFVDLRDMSKYFNEKEASKVLNFGVGIRGCLGRFYAKEFIKNFFENMVKEEFFQPFEGHLFSGRSNDKENFQESVYQITLFLKVLYGEIKRHWFNLDNKN